MSTISMGSFLFFVSSLLVTGFGVGRIPWMPGTWGSLLGCVLLYFCPLNIFTLVGLVLLSLIAIHYYEKQSHAHDSSEIIIDEIAGIFCSFFLLNITMPILIAGFILFRILDIAKPFPIGWVDRNVPGALGTLLDDIIAGFLTCIFLHLAVNWGWLY